MKVARRSPQRSLIDFFFDDAPTREMFQFPNANREVPRANILENKKEWKVELLAPGFSKENVKVELEENMLRISAEVKTEKEESRENYRRREFFTQNFERKFVLPETADTEKIEAEYKDGILTVNIPKQETTVSKTPKQISLK
jgi:HSP20 family protein